MFIDIHANHFDFDGYSKTVWGADVGKIWNVQENLLTQKKCCAHTKTKFWVQKIRTQSKLCVYGTHTHTHTHTHRERDVREDAMKYV